MVLGKSKDLAGEDSDDFVGFLAYMDAKTLAKVASMLEPPMAAAALQK
jgi:hypothetical protein